jgi:hypothetical protein
LFKHGEYHVVILPVHVRLHNRSMSDMDGIFPVTMVILWILD